MRIASPKMLVRSLYVIILIASFPHLHDKNVTGLGFENSEVEAHSGFLNSAEILEPLISERIKELAPPGVNHVLFTGHSAGGAVASLLYLSRLSRRNAECTLVTLYLVIHLRMLIHVQMACLDCPASLLAVLP